MTLAPGSMPWLMRHELRLYLRSGVVKGTSVTLLIILEVLLHLVAVGAAIGVRAAGAYAGSRIPAAVPALLITGGLAFCSLFMLSRGLNGIRRKGLMIGADLGIHIGGGYTLVQPMLSIGYEAF